MDVGRFVEARAQLNQRGDLFARVGGIDQRGNDGRIAARPVERDLEREHLRILHGGLDKLHDRIVTLVGMMEQDVLLAHDIENIGVRRQGRIARRLKDAVFEIAEGVVRHQRRQMGHGERTIEAVKIGLGQIEKFEEQLAKIARAIGFHFQAHGIAPAGAPQFLLDAAEQIIRLFFVDVEVAVPGDAKGVHAIEDQTREEIGDVVLDEGGEVDVIPRLVFLAPARHEDEAGQDARHLHDGVEQFARFVGARAHEEVVALVQELGERVAGIDRQRGEHREDFLLEITARPGGAFGVQLRDVLDADALLGERGREFVAPERILRGHHLVHGALDGVEGIGGRHPIRADIAGFAFDLLLDAGDANLEKLIEIRADDGEELDPLEQRLRGILRFLEDAAVELEPAQLAIDEIFRRGEMTVRAGFQSNWEGDDVGGRVEGRLGLGFGRHLSALVGDAAGI